MRRCVILTTVLSALWLLCNTGCTDEGYFAGAGGGGGVGSVGSHVPVPAQLGKLQLQYYWQARLPLEGAEHVARLYRLDENVYCLTDKNRLFAVDAATSLLKWQHKVADPAQTVLPPAHANGARLPLRVGGVKELLSTHAKEQALKEASALDIVAINTLSEVQVLDRQTGRQIRKIPFEFSANTGGSTDGECFYVGTTDGWYYAIRLFDAIPLWWGKTGDIIMAPPMVHGGYLFVASTDGGLQALAVAERGRRLWQSGDRLTLAMHGPVTAAFHVDDRGCFIPCEDHRVYAYHTASGRPLWEPFTCQGPLRDPIQVGTNTIFQYATGDKLYAINLANGKLRWSLPEGRKVLAVMDNDVYLLDKSGRLLVVDEILGKVKGVLPLAGLELCAGSATAPAVYAATRDGRVVCIRQKSAGHLTVDVLKGIKKP